MTAQFNVQSNKKGSNSIHDVGLRKDISMSKETKKGSRRFSFSMAILLVILNIILATWLILTLRPAFPAQYSAIAETSSQSMSQTELESEKLRQEIRQLEIENNRLNSPWQTVSSYATLLTAIVAVAGVFITIWKQFLERQRDREQRETESKRRFDEEFSSIIANIGSENTSLQVSATISLMTFLRDEYVAFHEQVYLVLLANLKVKHKLQINRLLIQAFEKAFRLKVASLAGKGNLDGFDLTNAHLYRINLEGMDLRNVDIAFAEMELANLEKTNLDRVKGYKTNLKKAQFTDASLVEARLAKATLEDAHFHRVNLVSSNLKDTNLRCAQFFQAKLQSAHLENADLSGARFEEADLNNTYFYGATFNLLALKSICKAYNWEKAHYDDDILLKLNEIR